MAWAQHDPVRTAAGRSLTLLVDGSMVDNSKIYQCFARYTIIKI